MGQIETKNYTSKNSSVVIVRTANQDDADAFLNLGKSIMSEHIYTMTQPDELNLSIEEEQQWLQTKIDNPNHLALVAEIGGKVVGQLDFSNGHKKRIAHTGEFGMGVCKEHRGNGIGSFLLKELVKWAETNPNLAR
jgi:GNAT superfamily N-acetyltransferase